MEPTNSTDPDDPFYDPETESYRVQPDPNDQISIVAIEAVARIANLDPLEMAPVYDGHNLDVLDQVDAMHQADEVDVDGAVTVTIAAYRVTVERDGTLVITPPA